MWLWPTAIAATSIYSNGTWYASKDTNLVGIEPPSFPTADAELENENRSPLIPLTAMIISSLIGLWFLLRKTLTLKSKPT
jgi:hypothetical protein